MSVFEALVFVPTFVLAFFRIAGMMLFAPLFGSARIPRRVPEEGWTDERVRRDERDDPSSR